MKKILIFTDSRGQHKPVGTNHFLFGERLKNEVDGLEVDLVLCPMKWTTTLDFFEFSEKNDVAKYDWIILYTGIVDWSPRPQYSAINDIYDNKNLENLENWLINTNDHSRKVVNNKKRIFDALFGAREISNHLNTPFVTEYEGHKTVNMYSREMAIRAIGPKLRDMENLIFINANRLLPDWEGDYKRGRPKNMSITHEISDAVSSFIPSSRLVDLRTWGREEIMSNTCDNMHLTKMGSDWIFENILNKIGMVKKSENEVINKCFDDCLEKDLLKLIDFKKGDRFVGGVKTKFISNYKIDKNMATLIIGLRLSDADPSRIKNISFLLEWLNYFYDDMFDVLLVEQDSERRLKKEVYAQYKNVRYEFIYNPFDYNRGWAYNVAVTHFCTNAKVVVLMDTDVLVGSGFVADVRDCFVGKYKVVSPYQNVYYTDEEEANTLIKTRDFSCLKNPDHIKNPVTITGGVVIFDKKTFLDLKGFEQYIGYGCEDRALDVMVMRFVEIDKIKITPTANVHLYHPSDGAARKNFKEIYQHLVEKYKCEYTPGLRKTEFIHRKCDHASTETLHRLLIEKHRSFADINLYRYEKTLTVNGRVADADFLIDSPILSEGIRMKNTDVVSMVPFFPRIHAAINQKNFLLANSLCKEAMAHYPTNSTISHLLLSKISEINKLSHGLPGDGAKATVALNPNKNKFGFNKDGHKSDTLVIMGNGPSLGYVDFEILKDVDTFGLNSAYRFYEELGFYPTYFGCFDNLVTTNHRESFQKLLSDPAIPIKRFFFIQSFDDPLNRLCSFKFNNKILAEWRTRVGVSKSLDDFWIYENSGASATHAGIAMGYKKIILLGVDCSYVQVVEGASQLGDKQNELVITDTPKKNPNYWRDDYQVKGDIYHVPDAQKYQKPEWERLNDNILIDGAAADVDVYNCSPVTTLDCFEKANLVDVLDINPLRLINSTTFLVKSFGRKDDIKNLVSSIVRLYPCAKITVFDDSAKFDSEDVSEIENCGCNILLSENFDVGLSEGRNILVRACKTKYMVLLDEDFVFSKKTDVIPALKLLSTSSLDIVGGSVFDVGKNAQPHNQPRVFNGNLDLCEDGKLIITPSEENPVYSEEGFLLSDLVLNFFVAKTESIRKVLWDPQLKLAEHLDFFLRAKDSNLKIMFMKSMQVKHIQDHSASGDEYMEYRKRAQKFNSVFKDKYSIKSIEKYGSKIVG